MGYYIWIHKLFRKNIIPMIGGLPSDSHRYAAGRSSASRRWIAREVSDTVRWGRGGEGGKRGEGRRGGGRVLAANPSVVTQLKKYTEINALRYSNEARAERKI